MPQWTKERADIGKLSPGAAYSKVEAARAMGVSPPGQRDWGGLVSFANAVALFITLEKTPERFREEHRYRDQFDGGLLYWDTRASHTKTSAQVRRLRAVGAVVIAFARVSEKEGGKTCRFSYVGPLEFVSWWGERPVHVTWRLREFADGLVGSPELQRLASWWPHDGNPAPRPETDGRIQGPAEPRRSVEGGSVRVVSNRYERDPRARADCIAIHGCQCHVCGFDFEATYGELGKNFIFVHHRLPVAVRAKHGEYELNPKTDLVPVCGNCHPMIHRRTLVDEPATGLVTGASARLAELRRLASTGAEWEAVD